MVADLEEMCNLYLVQNQVTTVISSDSSKRY